ncbi:hypothetical protein TSUD_340870, partial [Trifolium subterraneum]
MDYFKFIGCSPLITMNPAEFLLDLANGNMLDISIPSELEDKVHMGNAETETSNGKPSAAAVQEYLAEAYETKVAEAEKKKLMVPIPLDEEVKAKVCSRKRQWGASWLEQYSILFSRGFKERRHDYFSWLRITQVLSTAVILGLLWWQSDANNPKGLQDQYLNVILLFLLVVYFMAGLRLSAVPFFLSILTVFLCIVAAQGLGLAIGASLMDLKRATTLASVTVMTFMLAGGFFVQ